MEGRGDIKESYSVAKGRTGQEFCWDGWKMNTDGANSNSVPDALLLKKNNGPAGMKCNIHWLKPIHIPNKHTLTFTYTLACTLPSVSRNNKIILIYPQIPSTTACQESSLTLPSRNWIKRGKQNTTNQWKCTISLGEGACTHLDNLRGLTAFAVVLQ